MATRKPSRKKTTRKATRRSGRAARSAHPARAKAKSSAPPPRALPPAAAAPYLWPARVVRLEDVASGDPAMQPDSPEYGKRFLGEGDSWFSYNAVPHSANLLQQIHLPVPSIVLTLAKPGDTVRNMGTISSNPMLKRYLAERNFASNWDAILLSGGGNDLIDAVDRIIVAGTGVDPQNWIDRAALAATLMIVVDGFAAIVAARDAPGSVNGGKPIIVHTYDHPTPNNAPATFLGAGVIGPWFWPRFERLGLDDQSLRAAITDHVLDRLAQTLMGLATRFENFHVIDTRDTLVRAEPGATGNSNDWLNEIHPNSGGYRKIADRICAALPVLG